MIISREKLLAESSATGFRPDVMEKGVQVLGLLEALQGHPLLKGRLALKGGTAQNLFLFDVPRLSVDVDVNYIGSEDRDVDDVELAAGKLSALLARRASRDLFDAHHFLTRVAFDRRRLRVAFVVYGGINRRDWRTVSGPFSPSRRTRGSSSTACSTTARSSHPCSLTRATWSNGSGGTRDWNGRR